MAIENAKQFVEKITTDAALAERVNGLTLQEDLALAKELGLEFTEEDLKEALNNRELDPEELDEAAGGRLVVKDGYVIKDGKIYRQNGATMELSRIVAGDGVIAKDGKEYIVRENDPEQSGITVMHVGGPLG